MARAVFGWRRRSIAFGEALRGGKLVVYDTEWTSWPGFRDSGWDQPGRWREIIQIGAVVLDTDAGLTEIDAFRCVVKPARNPVLSDYIIDLTGITQAALDADGIPFASALETFVDFIPDGVRALACFGSDGVVLRENCALSGVDPPAALATREINVGRELHDLGIIEAGWESSELPARLGLASGQPAHDALGDARSIALVLPSAKPGRTSVVSVSPIP